MQNIVIRTSRSQIKQMVTTVCAQGNGSRRHSKTKHKQTIKIRQFSQNRSKTKKLNRYWSELFGAELSSVCLTEVTRLVLRVFLNENRVAACPARHPSFITCISVKLGADCVLCRISRLCNNRLSSVRLDWHRASSETLHPQTSALGVVRPPSGGFPEGWRCMI